MGKAAGRVLGTFLDEDLRRIRSTCLVGIAKRDCCTTHLNKVQLLKTNRITERNVMSNVKFQNIRSADGLFAESHVAK